MWPISHADTTDILAAKGDLYDNPFFAYCDNNPVVRVDYGGEFWEWAAIGAAVGALISGTYSAITQYIGTGKINWYVVGANDASGAIIGLVGGRGANAKSLETTWKAASKGITRETRRANEKYAAKRIAQYRLEQAVIKRTIKNTLGRMILSPIGSQIACKLIERIKRWISWDF